ncbi:MAG: hypothetical protein O2979_04440 [Proteobacteria bacterium]|nr:hypothetical protein [Pseudomonadota bacterium]
MPTRRHLALLLLLAFHTELHAQTDEPMIRWDCDSAGNKLTLEMVQPPVAKVNARELILLNGTVLFEQCRLGKANWTLLVDLVEYASGRCEVEPDTIVSLLRNDQLVISSVVIGENCGERPVLSAARITEPGNGEDGKIELCTARTYGAERRCSPLRLRGIKQAIDNDAIAAHARRSAGKPR